MFFSVNNPPAVILYPQAVAGSCGIDKLIHELRSADNAGSAAMPS